MDVQNQRKLRSTTNTRFVTFEPRFQSTLLLLHRSAIANLHIGMDRHDEERDLNDVAHVYLDSGGEFLVGLQGDDVVAMGGFKPVSEACVELKRMRVAVHLQGRGIGSALLAELESRAVRRGFREVCLETAKARPATLAFYTAHGYVMTGHSRYGEVETVQFAKQLAGQSVVY